MKILVLDKFYKSVPKFKQKKVREKVIAIVQEWEQTQYNFERLSKGSTLRKVEGVPVPIYKIHMSDGDRILCTLGGDFYKDIRPDFQKSLVLLEYCTHDKQIKTAKGRNFWKQDLQQFDYDNETSIIVEDKQGEIVIDFSLKESIPLIFDKDQLDLLFGEEGYLYYLDEIQYSCARLQEQGQIIFGSAGSGKTMIGVYKLANYVKANFDKPFKIGYITFSRRLKEKVEELFHNVAQHQYGLDRQGYKGKIEFLTLDDHLESLIIDGHKPKTVTYEKFKDWYDSSNNLKYPPSALWKERRGILKGIIGSNWQYDINLNSDSFDKKVLELLSNHSLIEYRENFLKLKVELDEICSFLQFQIGNEAEFRKLVIKEYNSIISNKKELTPVEYLQLKNIYTVFNNDEKEKIMALFKKFNHYLATIRQQGDFFYEEGDIVRHALINSYAYYDYLVIDEIQDFTELQVYYLCQLLKEKNNVLICGDFHQTIQPTFFSAGRIESIFKFLGGMNQFTKTTLENNYRSSKEIVDFANGVAAFRSEYVPGKLDFNYKEIPKRQGSRKPYLFRGSKDQLLASAKDKSYILIVVPDEQTKKKLVKDTPGLESRVVTVTEIKGIERKYIITYNLISAHKEHWRSILSQKDRNDEAHRYYFNVLYVGITRARDVLGIIEDDLSDEIFQRLGKFIDVIDHFDISKLDLNESSSMEHWYEEANDLEKSGNYANAIAAYVRIQEGDSEFYKRLAHIGTQRCRIKEEYLLSRDHAICGEKLFELKEYEEAIEPLYKAKDGVRLLQAILLVSGLNRYNVNKMLEECGIHPITVLMELKSQELLMKYFNHEILAFQSNMNNLIQSTNEVHKVFALKQ